MTETTPATTPPSNDTINVLTALSTNEGTISLTINVDKSTAKKVVWWVFVVIGAILLLMAAILFFLGKNYAALDVAAREDRLAQQAFDDKRLENRAAWKQLGVDGNALENHDISDILDAVRKKHPPKEGE